MISCGPHGRGKNDCSAVESETAVSYPIVTTWEIIDTLSASR
ncbi:MAG: hypothetical protein ACLS9N_13255 [[Clostridium] leptum]